MQIFLLCKEAAPVEREMHCSDPTKSILLEVVLYLVESATEDDHDNFEDTEVQY
jgi:hypothetical protein